MNKTILLTGVVFGLLAVVFGAFGAHGLEKMVEPEAISTFEIGVRYQMYHALFLLFIGLWTGLKANKKRIVYTLIVLGIALFSFSIYGLALNSIIKFDFRSIAFLTPIGGVFLIFGWFFTGYFILTQKRIN
ncbi:DUF423 domain-containing protein [Muricauda sp. JGD-17]|uniref:DUF423 domain-containing protein n=1 Tax=Flagellimonas ochracea TaxID=2696472 RepID=A0A964TBW6_9FLAO|nr:DUF423 domain-containing protein [Allomuricauda ochracea]NAY92023.1 DUF423 domain-containing protein [Allomuricauda ochracea]